MSAQDQFAANLQPDGTYKFDTLAEAQAASQAGIPNAQITFPDPTTGQPTTATAYVQQQQTKTLQNKNSGPLPALEKLPVVGGAISRVAGAAAPQDPYNNLAATETTAAGQAQDLANTQRSYIEQGGDTALGYLQPEQSAYNNVYGPGGSLSGPTTSQTAYDQEFGAGGSLSGPTNSQGAYQQTASALAGPTAIENYTTQQMGTADPFTAPGQAEQLYAQRLASNGLDPYSAMELKAGMGANDANAAGAGNYNSGGRLAADALLTSTVEGNAYNNMATEAQQAQAAESTRLGQDQARDTYLGSLAQDSTNAFTGRLAQIGAAGATADTNNLARGTAATTAASSADTQNQAKGNASIKDQGAISGTAAGLSANTTQEAANAYGSAAGGAIALQIAAAQAKAQGQQAQNTQTGNLLTDAVSLGTTGKLPSSGATSTTPNNGPSSATPSAGGTTGADPYSPDGLLTPTWA